MAISTEAKSTEAKSTEAKSTEWRNHQAKSTGEISTEAKSTEGRINRIYHGPYWIIREKIRQFVCGVSVSFSRFTLNLLVPVD